MIRAMFLCAALSRAAHFLLRGKYILPKESKYEKKLLEEIKITVAKQTAAELRKQSEFQRLSIGELIDRTFMPLCTNNAETAYTLILDYMGIVTCEQNDEQVEKTLLLLMYFCYDLIMGLEKYTPDKLMRIMEKNRKTIKEYKAISDAKE